MTPYYEHAGITIYHGDCREILPTLPKCDLLLTDIPYGKVNRADSGLRSLDKGSADDADFDLQTVIESMVWSCIGSIYVWCGTEQVSPIRAAMVFAMLSTRLCVWEKTDPSPMNGQHLWLSSIEVCVYGKRPKAVFNEFCASPVFRGPSADTNGHPTPKPEWLMRKIVNVSANAGQTLIDPFCGSGTSLVAAKALGLTAIGIDNEERWCELSAKRLSQEVFDFQPERELST